VGLMVKKLKISKETEFALGFFLLGFFIKDMIDNNKGIYKGKKEDKKCKRK